MLSDVGMWHLALQWLLLATEIPIPIVVLSQHDLNMAYTWVKIIYNLNFIITLLNIWF